MGDLREDKKSTATGQETHQENAPIAQSACICIRHVFGRVFQFARRSGLDLLIDGAQGLENWNVLSDENWRSQDGSLVADKGSSGFLVSKAAYKDFTIYAEFWAATDTNNGIFTRAADPTKIGADNSCEVMIWDIRPDPSYGTAAIVNFAKVTVPFAHKAGGQWNTMEVTAQGASITFKLL